MRIRPFYPTNLHSAEQGRMIRGAESVWEHGPGEPPLLWGESQSRDRDLPLWARQL